MHSLRQNNRLVGIMIAVLLFTLATFIILFDRYDPLSLNTSIPTDVVYGTVSSLLNPKFLKDTSLIHIDDTCDAPCWRGIIPGVTKFSDALIILENDPNFDDPHSQSLQESDTAIIASWQTVGGDPCCQLVAEDGETVTSMFFQLAPDLTVKQLIDARGEPEYVLGNPARDDQAIINLFYPEYSMTVFVFIAGTATGTLSENSEIIGVFYTTPHFMDLSLKLGNFYGWKGYQPFSAYVPDPSKWETMTPDYKVTQSVTLTPTGGTATPRPSS